MKKKVNIKSPNVLYIFTPPMSGVFNNQKLSTGDIKNCILQGAHVEEILSDGKLVRLDLTNFDKDNEIPKPEIRVEEKKIKDPEKIKNKVEEKEVEPPKDQEIEVDVKKVESDTRVEEPVDVITDTHPEVDDSTSINSEVNTEEQHVDVTPVKEEKVVEQKTNKQENTKYKKSSQYSHKRNY